MSDIAWDGPPPKPPLGTPLMRWHPLACGLVGFWLMNERAGNVLVNSVSKITNGLLAGTNMWSPRGYAVRYPGSAGSYALVPPHASLKPTTALTITTRVRLSAISGAPQQPVRGLRGSLYGYSVSVHYPTTGSFTIFLRLSTDVPGTAVMPTQWANSFNELTAAWDGTTLRLYGNGVLAGSSAATGVAVYDPNPSIETIFGAAETTSASAMQGGEQAHVALWNRGLSAAEVLAFYRDPYGLFRWPSYRGVAAQSGSPFFFQRYVAKSA